MGAEVYGRFAAGLCTQPDIRRRVGEPQMGRRLHPYLDGRRLALCRRCDESLLTAGGRMVHECHDDRSACDRYAGDGDLAARHAQPRIASL